MGLYEPTNTYRDFNSTINDGQVGEKLLKDFLVHKGFKVIDRSEDPLYQSKDIDFEFSKTGKSWKSVEVKADSRMTFTGNIVVEVAMQRQTCRMLGWLYKCEADYLCFIDMQTYKFYFFDWHKLKSEVLNGRWKVKTFKNGTDNCIGELCIIPLQELADIGLMVVEDRIYFG